MDPMDNTGMDWEGDMDPSDDEFMENPEEVLAECVDNFTTPDYIMEPGIFSQLKRYFQAGGNPESVIELLSKNYTASAQMSNLLAEWLILSGVSIPEIQAIVENSLKETIVRTFDPKKADKIFTEEGETPAWLTQMIQHPTWRSLIYRLAEEYPDCLMLNFTIKLISDAGFQAEITSISTAAQQIEVFSRVLKTAISGFLQNSDNRQSINDCARMVCHGQHTYVYSQVLLQILSQETNGGFMMKRLSQEITKCAQDSKYDVTPITMALNGAAGSPDASQALASMLSKDKLNPADINVLYRYYSSGDPPPIELVRNPQFLELLLDSLFKPGIKLNPEHKSKYIYLLAYAASVCDTVDRQSGRRELNKGELEETMGDIEKAHVICSSNQGSADLVDELGILRWCIRLPVVSVGIIKWVECTVMESSYFKLSIKTCPVHMDLLDEIVEWHSLLHPRVLQLLVKIFESKQDELEVLEQLQMKKMLVGRMVKVLSQGYVMPVVKYIRQCWQKGDTDISLIRYFVVEVLAVLDVFTEPPSAHPEFVELFLPMVENEEITGTLTGDTENDLVSKFIIDCKDCS